ncbi:hypothetical protein EV363DRAFT_1346923 [Boletus edulis]|nr:hypothetical protein EV363DRAFT_1346923 [Boletus edulis]
MPDPSSSSFLGPSRSNSSASTASSSGASLSRRSRIARKRTGTIIATSRCDERSTELVDQVLDISTANNADLVSGMVASNPGTPNSMLATHARPWGRLRFVLYRSCATFGTFGPPTGGHEASPADSAPVHTSQHVVAMSSETAVSPATTKGKGRHPPRITSPPSSFKPTPTDADRVRSSLRDSLLTQQSSTSSSLYPMSTSMGTESPPSPQSPTLPGRGIPMPALELEAAKVQEFDADDVSYRLQLLVKNNYFLPPAHSKPCPADFPSSLNNSKKALSPTFFDLFRVGKPRPKPMSPDVANGTSPIFRVTSDSTTSGQLARDHGRPSPQTFRPPPGSQHMARVVVVREKMQDLAAAARQAEVNLGRRDFSLDRDRASRKAKFATFDGIVDVPPPSANYPLPLQASALHGLGIEDSVGAAILAERLPPPDSPGQSSLDPREDAWRKALLREAVGHSLNNSRATSAASRYSSPSNTPFHARSSELLRPDPVVEQQRRLLDQKILSHPIIDPMEDDFAPAPMTSSALNPSASVAIVADPDRRRLLCSTTPLSPPPRRLFGNPQFSQSQTNISPASGNTTGQTPRMLLRRSIRTGPSHQAKPPPMPFLSISPASFDGRLSGMTTMSRDSGSEHEAADEQPGRPTDGRPSISEYSQPSPTASAFRDRWTNGYYSANSGGPEEGASVSRNSSLLHQAPRPSTMSPPPRPSSSLVGIALSPPPRAGHLPLRVTSPRTLAIPSTRSFSQSTTHSFSSNSTLSQSTHAHPQLFLNTSSQSFHSALHSAPPPSSATEFFDHIQAHTDAMDDLDDSDDSNLSSPNVYPGAKEPYYPSVIPTERRRPVGHTAPKIPYFSSVKAAPDSLTHLSLAQHSREHLPTVGSPDSRHSSDAENIQRWRTDQESFQESSRRLDGLLIRHMQAEKDTLKRIAQTAKVAKS